MTDNANELEFDFFRDVIMRCAIYFAMAIGLIGWWFGLQLMLGFGEFGASCTADCFNIGAIVMGFWTFVSIFFTKPLLQARRNMLK